jgi:hypothetical protein
LTTAQTPSYAKVITLLSSVETQVRSRTTPSRDCI